MNVSKKSILFSLLFGFIIVLGALTNYHDTYAVSDLSTTFTSGTSVTSSTRLFPDCNLACYADYHYLIISVSSFPSTVLSKNIMFRNSNDLTLSLPFIDSIYSLRSGDYALSFIENFSFSYDVTFKLSADLPSSGSCITPSGSLSINNNGTFDVSTYASVVVDVPNEENSQFMGVVIDSFWQYHVAFASASVGIIVIFLVYRIIKGRLR